jgi:hypothetical protein
VSEGLTEQDLNRGRRGEGPGRSSCSTWDLLPKESAKIPGSSNPSDCLRFLSYAPPDDLGDAAPRPRQIPAEILMS